MTLIYIELGAAVVWFSLSYFLPPLGALVACIHLGCTIIDMMMNGAGEAEFAPYNLAGAALAGAGAALGNG